MNSKDLDIAIETLDEKDLSLCIVKNRRILFESSSRGITGFLGAIEDCGDELVHASVADKVVGRAVALLCLHMQAKEVYGSVMSVGAISLLQERAVYIEWSEKVESILSDCKSAVCPFESLAKNLSEPDYAYKKLKALQHSLQQSE